MTEPSPSPSGASRPPRRRRRGLLLLVLLAIFGLLGAGVWYEDFPAAYDAEYIGAAACGVCHTQVYEQWQSSPHANMTRPATRDTVVGDFGDHQWHVPERDRRKPEDHVVAARMYRRGDDHFMALFHPPSGKYVPFKVDYVIGYQYRQTYLTREEGGVLRRLPLQWSVEKQRYFPYWNVQEQSPQSVGDLWLQMRSQNSAWNLFCARCHTTKLEIEEKNADHTRAKTRWVDDGIACEACHGPGSHHATYFERNYVNRIAAFLKSKLRGEPVAFIANGPKLDKGQDLSVCARCHGPDIMMVSTDVYRIYEPGYSATGRVNDLSPHFREFPLQPGRKDPTVECWEDGRPKGIGMLFRSFVESACYQKAEPRCYDCHDPHANKQPRVPGILQAGPVSDAYCLKCHADLRDRIAEHTHHEPGTRGAHCYDCHMAHDIQNLVGGFEKFVRSHQMSAIPRPDRTVELGADGAPNACNECHDDRSPRWAADWVAKWW